ncbi:hypothetical protein ACLB2K_022588 [Fragaria x ananassa]
MVMSDESGGLGYDQNGDGNDVKPQQTPPQHENGESSKQNSIFLLTLDEIQSKSGKSFGSMNMDEFLANIWSVDENQLCEEQPNQGDHEDPCSNVKDTISKPLGSLSRQGSYCIPTPLCKKTVDEPMRSGQRSTKLNHHPRLLTKVALLIFATVMLLLVFIGFVLSMCGKRFLVHWYENPDMELKRKEAEQLKDDKVKQTYVGGDVDKADVGLALHL